DLCLDRGADPFDPQLLYNASLGPDETQWLERLWTASKARGRLEAWRRDDGRPIGGRVPCSALDFLLGAAVQRNHLQRAAWLLAHGARASTLHAYTAQPVHTEARLAGFAEMMALLEAHGATPEPLTGERALRAAVMRGDEAEARREVAADPSLVRHPAVLIGVASHGSAEGLAFLLSLGADITVRDHQGATALHRAVQSGSLDAVTTLLAAGDDPDVRDGTWRGTPFGWACHFGQDAVAAHLATITRDVRTLAREAALDRLAEVLAEAPALVNVRLAGDPAPTPVFCLPDDEALAEEVAALLRARGADLRIRDGAGRTPAEAARARGLEGAATVLA
ncbi:MAG TPA: ankyrin repeat domain-containing protein, partial [Gemmatimonadales bacterium]|nr:ankyrin repeat domain-containing protein [Gemmatimonadales bacterium]